MTKTSLGKVELVATFNNPAELRNAVVIKRGNSFIVGKNYLINDDDVCEWSWGVYDILTEKKALKIAENWIEGR